MAAGLADIFAAVRFKLDTQSFEAEAAAAGTKAGRTAGDKMSGQLSSQLKTKLKATLAMGLAVGFAAITKQGLELNETLTEVQGRSGAVGEQWDRMSDAIQKRNRDTTLSLQEIGDGVAALKTDLGLAGDEMDTASKKLTDFGLVAREVFADSVRGADDLKDAFNLTLAETFVVLDTLVASQQKYGGVITQNRAALVKLAPALSAANLSWQEGNELINLANASGVDAADMITALQKALTKVKSPEELRTLIADIQETEDGFLRSEKASDLFGAKAGAKMAAVLAPGKGALEDYGLTAEETAGRVDKAAEQINSSWNRRIALAVENVTGFLASIGNATGPVLSIVGSLGEALHGVALVAPDAFSKLMGKLGLARGQSPATPLFTSDVGLAGAAAGKTGLLGTLLKGVFPAGVILGIGTAIGTVIVDALGGPVGGTQDAGTGRDLGNFLGVDWRLGQSPAALVRMEEERRRRAIAHANVTAGSELFGPPAPGTANGGASELEWTSGWSRGVDKLHEDLVKAIEVIRTSNDPKAVADAIAAVLKSVLGGEGNAAQTQALVAELAAKRDAALARGDTATAQAFANAIAKIEPLAKGRQWQAEQIDQAKRIVDSNKTTADKVAALKDIQQDLLAHNRTMAADLVQKLIDVETAVKNIKISAQTGFSLTGPYSKPPAPGSKPPPKGGGGKTPTVNPSTGFVTGFAAGGFFRPRQPMLVGELRPELLIPDVGGRIEPRVSGGGSTTINNNLQVQGLVRARDPFEIVTQLRRVGSFGVLTPRREPA